MRIINKLFMLACTLAISFRGCFINYNNKKEIKSLVSKLYNKLDHIDRVEIKIMNPSKIHSKENIFNHHLYSLKIFIINDDTYLIKTIEGYGDSYIS